MKYSQWGSLIAYTNKSLIRKIASLFLYNIKSICNLCKCGGNKKARLQRLVINISLSFCEGKITVTINDFVTQFIESINQYLNTSSDTWCDVCRK